MIKDPQEINRRIRQLIETGTATSIEGKTLKMEYDSICVHGDTPGALEMIRNIRNILAEHSISVKPLAEIL